MPFINSVLAKSASPFVNCNAMVRKSTSRPRHITLNLFSNPKSPKSSGKEERCDKWASDNTLHPSKITSFSPSGICPSNFVPPSNGQNPPSPKLGTLRRFFGLFISSSTVSNINVNKKSSSSNESAYRLIMSTSAMPNSNIPSFRKFGQLTYLKSTLLGSLSSFANSPPNRQTSVKSISNNWPILKLPSSSSHSFMSTSS